MKYIIIISVTVLLVTIIINNLRNIIKIIENVEENEYG